MSRATRQQRLMLAHIATRGATDALAKAPDELILDIVKESLSDALKTTEVRSMIDRIALALLRNEETDEAVADLLDHPDVLRAAYAAEMLRLRKRLAEVENELVEWRAVYAEPPLLERE